MIKIQLVEFIMTICSEAYKLIRSVAAGSQEEDKLG
jgi:hypothetical protein